MLWRTHTHTDTCTHRPGLSIATKGGLLKQCSFLPLVFLLMLRIQSHLYDPVTCNGEHVNRLPCLTGKKKLPSRCVRPGTPCQQQVAPSQVDRPSLYIQTIISMFRKLNIVVSFRLLLQERFLDNVMHDAER